MKTKIHSQSGIFNPRILVAFALGSVGVLLAMLSFAANPASSTPLAPTGTAWSIVTSPNTSPAQENQLYVVTCASASDCWAVGSYITYVTGSFAFYHHTLVEHWNGAAWSIVTSPNTSTTKDNDLLGVTCTSASDSWADGFDVDDSAYAHLIVRHRTAAAGCTATSQSAR